MAIHEIIVTMANDLSIKKFHNESEVQFSNRVLYSAMSCWIKTTALDQSITEKKTQGVSKKHILGKCSRILNEMLSRNPQSTCWFNVENEDNPIVIIRQRLLQCGDLVNVGYDTNVGLSIKHEKELGYGIRQLIGSIYEDKYIYSGIALTSSTICENLESIIPSTIDWFQHFLKYAWWKAGSCIDAETEYFDAGIPSANNYSCWSQKRGEAFNSVLLTRHPLYNQAYEYILEKKEHGNTYYHKVDMFLQESKEHRRMMFALRSFAQNPVEVKKYEFCDHVQLCLRTYLPDKEHILLETFAWPQGAITDKLNWNIQLFIWPYIQANLEGLGIKIMEVGHG